MRVVASMLLIIIALPAMALEWEYLGMDGVTATCITIDPDRDRVFVGTYEGFHYYDLATGIWTDRDWSGSIGRQVWAIDHDQDLDGRVITGRENAFFKGYMEYSDDLGATETFVYESTGGRVTDVVHGYTSRHWACTWSDIADGELLRSEDGGESWTALPGHGFHAMTDLTFDLGGELVLAGDAGVKRSWDHGDTWEDMTGDLPAGYGIYCALGAYPGGDAFPWTSLFASNDLGLYYSFVVGQWEQMLDASCRHLIRIPVPVFLAGDRICAITWDGRVMVTRGGWDNWIDETATLPGTPVASAFSPYDNGLYVITANHGLWRAPRIVSDVESAPALRLDLAAYPNPFNPRTTLRFTLPEAGHVSLRIFDVAGREIAVLLDEWRTAGEQIHPWNAEALPSGIYLASVKSAAQTATKRLVLLK